MCVRATNVAAEKQNITYPEYVFAYLDIQHALRMHRTVIRGLFGSATLFLLSHERYEIRRKNFFLNIMCFDFFYNFRLKHFSSQEEMSEISKCILVFT